MATIQAIRSARRGFFGHFVEMLLAMVLGMAVLGALVSLIFALLDRSDVFDRIEVRAFVMATNMTLGMSLWMLYRGHSATAVAEMAAAMFIPLLVLAGPRWAGLLSDGALMGLMHLLMLPAMLAAMWRRRHEYANHHACTKAKEAHGWSSLTPTADGASIAPQASDSSPA